MICRQGTKSLSYLFYRLRDFPWPRHCCQNSQKRRRCLSYEFMSFWYHFFSRFLRYLSFIVFARAEEGGRQREIEEKEGKRIVLVTHKDDTCDADTRIPTVTCCFCWVVSGRSRLDVPSRFQVQGRHSVQHISFVAP